jgi:hypothetical protein
MRALRRWKVILPAIIPVAQNKIHYCQKCQGLLSDGSGF